MEAWGRVVGRRSFLSGLGAVGAAGALPLGAWAAELPAVSRLTPGDAAILRFVAAAELIEHDLWRQYDELGGASGGNHAYQAALENLDGDMPQYVSDNTDDELSHARFLNAYLAFRGAEPVSLDRWRTLPGSSATGSSGIGRLTDLRALRVDTSWYTRYRSPLNPDLGGTFAQAVTFPAPQPAIPLDDADTPPGMDVPVPPATTAESRIQAIANTAAFHFAMIEQGGASLYATLCLKATSLEVLRILVSIGGVEVDHFAVWHDKAGNAVSQPLAGVTDPETGVTFPDLNSPPGDELRQTNLILPEPCAFLSAALPACSVIRPTADRDAGALAAVTALTGSGLFDGQSEEFLRFVRGLAEEADEAVRRL